MYDGLTILLEKRALEVGERKPLYARPFSGIVGRIASPISAAVIGSTAPLRKTPKSDDPEIAGIIRKLKLNPKYKGTYLSLGSNRPLTALKRTWKNDRLSLPGKILGTVLWPTGQAMTALSRGSHYDPFADMVTLYDKHPDILRHEFGHVRDFHKRKSPALYSLSRFIPPIKYMQEGIASRHALRDVVSPALRNRILSDSEIADINRANRTLGGGMGSYLASDAAKLINYIRKHSQKSKLGLVKGTGLAVGGGLLGQLVGRTTKPFIPSDMREDYAKALDRKKGR
jgi:hypothetical protein